MAYVMKRVILKPELKNQTRSSAERERRYIKWFGEIGIEDVPLVGGKTASLGEMFRELTPKGVNVPDGFAITVAGYWRFLRETGLDKFIAAQLLDLDTNNVKQLQKCGGPFETRF
jgi:pyruvate,water dikinase